MSGYAARDTLNTMKVVVALVFCLLVIGPPITSGQSPEKVPQPNLFLITIDTLRADHVHCYGYDRIQTPALDSIARDGIRFAQAFTPSPITNSSHTSILTGLLPSSHGVSDFGVPLSPAHPTLAELLAALGYQTGAFIGAVILDSKRLAPGLDRGFAFYDNFPEHTASKSRWGRLERRGAEVEAHAESWLNQHRDGPHFVWIHFYDPHDPYEPPSPYSEIYKDRLYDGEIAYADSALGHFLAYLKQRGWYDRALIVVVGDHGEGLGEHQEDTHGIFLYDSTTHVPLLVKLPKNQDAGRQVQSQVRTTDIMPTILELAGSPIPAKLDGSSLSLLFGGTEADSRLAFGQTDYPLRFGWAPLRSVRTPAFKFIEAPNPELYDLRSDSGERTNRYEPWNSEVQSLRKSLSELNRGASVSLNPSPAAVAPGTVDELHALGYLGSADARSATDVPEPSLLPDPKDKIEQQNLLHTAMMAIENDDPQKARRSLEKVFQLDRKSVFALQQLGQLEVASRNYPQAVQYFRQASEMHPDDALLALDYGRALGLNNDLPAARAVLEKSLKRNANQPEARLLLGQFDLQANQYQAAENEFESALLLKPASEEGQIGLAKALMGEQKFADAVEFLETSTAESKDAELFELLAEGYQALGKTEQANRAKKRAQSLRAANPPH
jgi:arylsulfatase A-like enzyme/Tfp pilus assembly protein PilF